MSMALSAMECGFSPLISEQTRANVFWWLGTRGPTISSSSALACTITLLAVSIFSPTCKKVTRLTRFGAVANKYVPRAVLIDLEPGTMDLSLIHI